MSVDFNDGNWHQWHNDRKCPFHLKSKVEVVTPDGLSPIMETSIFSWYKATVPILAFRVVEVFPEELQVGDLVTYDGRGGFTLLYIHHLEKDNSDRKFGVIAFQGDIPKAVRFHELKLDTEGRE